MTPVRPKNVKSNIAKQTAFLCIKVSKNTYHKVMMVPQDSQVLIANLVNTLISCDFSTLIYGDKNGFKIISDVNGTG